VSSATRARQRSRDLLVRALYQWQIAGTPGETLIAELEADGKLAKLDEQHFRLLLDAVLENAESLDAIIAGHAARGLDQLDAVGRAVLLMALAELRYCADVPTKVVINEAVELAKRYGATDSFRFVNAVLDKAAREIRSAERA
jgi:N utilization substance protein B